MTAPLYAGIVRVSHMGDRKAGSDSFHADEDQIREVERYAKMLGSDVEYMPPELDVSGGLPIEERPSLKAAIEGVENGRYAGIISAYLSRLTRSRSGIEIWDRVEAVGGHVHCARENLDTSTPNGRYIRDIHLANAVREREEHVERFDTRRSLATAVGIWQTRVVPKGYVKGPDRKLIPGPDAPLVVEAFKIKAAGAGMVEIAALVGMTVAGATRMLRNRVYLGEVKSGRYSNPDAHPPLVSEELFAGAQTAAARPSRGVAFDSPALLAGLVRCSGCGHIMSRRAARSPFYGCHRYHSVTVCPAAASIAVSLLDAYVDRIARQVWNEMEANAQRSGTADAEREAAKRSADELAAYLAATSAFDDPEFQEGARIRKEAKDRDEAALEAKLATLTTFPSGVSYDDLTISERNRWMRSWMSAVVVERSGGRGVIRPVEERVRVLGPGAADMIPARVSGKPMGLCPIPLPDADSEVVIRPLAA